MNMNIQNMVTSEIGNHGIKREKQNSSTEQII